LFLVVDPGEYFALIFDRKVFYFTLMLSV